MTQQCLFQIRNPVLWVSSILNLGFGFPLPRMGIIIAIVYRSHLRIPMRRLNHSTGYDISEATLPSFPSIVQLDCPLVTVYHSKTEMSCRRPCASILSGQERELGNHSQSLQGAFGWLRFETRHHPRTLASSSVHAISPTGLRQLLLFYIIMGNEVHMIF